MVVMGCEAMKTGYVSKCAKEHIAVSWFVRYFLLICAPKARKLPVA